MAAKPAGTWLPGVSQESVPFPPHWSIVWLARCIVREVHEVDHASVSCGKSCVPKETTSAVLALELSAYSLQVQ